MVSHPLFGSERLALVTGHVPQSVKVYDQHQEFLGEVDLRKMLGPEVSGAEDEIRFVDARQVVLRLQLSSWNNVLMVAVFAGNTLSGYVRLCKRPGKLFGINMERRSWTLAGAECLHANGPLFAEWKVESSNSKSASGTLERASGEAIAHYTMRQATISRESSLEMLGLTAGMERPLVVALALLIACDMIHNLPSATAKTVDSDPEKELPNIRIEEHADRTVIVIPPLDLSHVGVFLLARFLCFLISALFFLGIGGLIAIVGPVDALSYGICRTCLVIGGCVLLSGIFWVAWGYQSARQRFHLEIHDWHLELSTRFLWAKTYRWSNDELYLLRPDEFGIRIVLPRQILHFMQWWEGHHLLGVATRIEQRLGVKATARWERTSPPTNPIPFPDDTCVQLAQDGWSTRIEIPGTLTVATVNILIRDNVLSYSKGGMFSSEQDWHGDEIEEIEIREIKRSKSTPPSTCLYVSVEGVSIPILGRTFSRILSRHELYAVADLMSRALWKTGHPR